MTVPGIKHRPMKLATVKKTEARSQFGAICYRIREGRVQILLITSRRRGRWVIPKGWPMHDETPAGAAAMEAFQEAGAVGKLSHSVLGFYAYAKRNKDGGGTTPCVVAVFPLRVSQLVKDYPEKSQRKRKWFPQAKAADLLDEPELARMVRDFDPKMLRN